jgi:hypothetical protein
VAQEGRVIYDIREVSKGGIDWVLLATVRTLGFALGSGKVDAWMWRGVYGIPPVALVERPGQEAIVQTDTMTFDQGSSGGGRRRG